MSAQRACRWYLGALFIMMMSNGISAVGSALGLRGFAFYHVQACVLVLCTLQFGVLILSGRIETRMRPEFLRLILASILYTLLSSVMLLRFEDITYPYVALITHTLLFYPTTALLMLGCARTGEECRGPGLPTWISWVAAAVILFGWLQFGVGKPILEVTNNTNVSKLVETNALGTFRPPSVFESSFQYGLFSLLTASLAISTGQAGKRTAWPIALLGVSGVALSQTRNVYLCAACTAVSFVLLRLGRKHKWSHRLLGWAPLGYLLSAVAVMAYAVWGFLQSGLQKSGDLADASSTWARVSGWQRAWESLVQRGTVFDFLFGYGITQAGHASDYRSLYPSRGEGLFIDNTFINIFLLQGVFGVLFFLSIWCWVWRRLLQVSDSNNEPLAVGLMAYFSAFLAAGMFNILNGQWWGITVALVIVILSRREQQCTQICAA